MCWHIFVGWCYCHVADVKPHIVWGWYYLLFLVVDVKTTVADVNACYISLLLADVIANPFVADIKTT